MSINNLTRDEARQRAGLVSELHYEVDLDLTTGDHEFGSDTTVAFRCATPGGSTFIDLTAAAVDAAELNGRPLPADAFDGNRLRLDGLTAENRLRVRARCTYEHTGVGLHRFTDPVDGEVYLYTQFEPFDAHRVFPCFDQPDLKATFALAVRAPDRWEVVSNGRPTRDDGQWRFGTTPLLSTYLVALVAGPYHAVRDSHDGIELGVFCRQSLARYLDADDILDITRSGFDYFRKSFAYDYPFEKYDQLFVPEFNAGAMENAGCVTISESYVFRSKVTDAERERRAETILHEMAHMWFGDLVTMRWWDDLWLNESFATYMSLVSLEEATRFRSPWTTFASVWKTWAYRQDQLPSTHPIVADAPDVDTAKTNFDGITYAKGASVLRQLVAWVGDDAFFEGVRDYFRQHEWSNTELADFLGALAEASGRDLDAWSREWLQTAGVATLRPRIERDGDVLTSVAIEQEAPEQWPTLRSHRVGVGLYDDRDGRLVRRDRVELDVVGALTPVAGLTGVRAPDLLLVNDGDLTFAKIRLDPASLATLTGRLGALEDPLARSLCWAATWDMLRDAELPARRYLAIVLANAGHETEIGVVQQLLRQASSAALVLGDPAHRDESRQRLADAARAALASVPAGGDHQLAWARAFIGAARAPEHVQAVRGLLDGSFAVDGLVVDTDLRWHIVASLAAGGSAGDDVIDAEEARDPTDLGRRHAAGARAARPDPEAKASAWRAITEDEELPLATMEAMMGGFQQPGQEELLAPYAERFFAALQPMWERGVLEVALSFAEAMYPAPVARPEVIELTDAYLGAHDPPPPIRRLLVEGRDQVERVLRARACDRGG